MSKTGKIVLCLFEKDRASEQIAKILSDKGYRAQLSKDIHDASARLFTSPPDMMIISTTTPGWEEFVTRIKNDPLYKHLPLLLLTAAEELLTLSSASRLACDDVLVSPLKEEEVLLRLQLREASAILNLDANPLTHLPGNVTILATMQKTLAQKESSALCYLDLDNFKAFNDRYGFTRGDEAIRMTARVITNVVHDISPSDSFVGHVGGDDFFFIVPAGCSRQCCERIIEHFDLVIQTLIDDEDLARGYFESRDRRGNSQQFPLLSLSIAVIDLTITRIDHPGEVSAIAGEMKKAVKKLKGSNYMVNKRKARTESGL